MLERKKDEEEWCIVRLDRRGYLLVMRKPSLPVTWNILATGFKSNEEAIKYVPLFNEG